MVDRDFGRYCGGGGRVSLSATTAEFEFRRMRIFAFYFVRKAASLCASQNAFADTCVHGRSGRKSSDCQLALPVDDDAEIELVDLARPLLCGRFFLLLGTSTEAFDSLVLAESFGSPFVRAF